MRQKYLSPQCLDPSPGVSRPGRRIRLHAAECFALTPGYAAFCIPNHLFGDGCEPAFPSLSTRYRGPALAAVTPQVLLSHSHPVFPDEDNHNHNHNPVTLY